MSFKSVLQKIEEDVQKGVSAASVFFPVLAPIAALIPTIGPALTKYEPIVVDKLQQSVNAVQDVQGLFAAAGIKGPGSDKAKAIAPKLAALLMDCETIGGKKIGSVIKDEAAFNDAVTRAAGCIADALKACGD